MRDIEITIGHLYPKELNLYGDRGNIDAFLYRCSKAGIKCHVVPITKKSADLKNLFKKADILFMGGGPDSMQKEIFNDFVGIKGPFVREHISKGRAGLFICGAYQLLGKYYRPYSGPVIKGLGVLDFYTEHYGRDAKRCVGNIVIDASKFLGVNSFSNYLVGFENHGGNTYLSKGLNPLGKVVKGFGNNFYDGTEGVFFKNTVGTYLHGPILPKNPHLTDHIIKSALFLKYRDKKLVSGLDFSYCDLEKKAHKVALKIKRQ